jgi:hypothetical protein
MVNIADFDEAYRGTSLCHYKQTPCKPPHCFIGSYPPVTPAGKTGPFFVNTKYLQPSRYAETVGVVPIRSSNACMAFKK